jgi:hypothetical protein
VSAVDPARRLEIRARLAAEIARELDVPAEAVEAAMRAAYAERLDEAAAAGAISAEAAAALLEAYDEGTTSLRLFTRLLRERLSEDGPDDA